MFVGAAGDADRCLTSGALPAACVAPSLDAAHRRTVLNQQSLHSGCKNHATTSTNACRWNHPLLEQAAAAAGGDGGATIVLQNMFYGAHCYGLNSVRLFGFGVQNKTVLQPAPGIGRRGTTRSS